MTDMEFVQNFTPPDFQAKNFTPSISPNFNSFSKKKHKKWVKMEKFTPLAKILHCRRQWRHGQIPSLKSRSESPNDNWVKLTQKQTGNEIWLQPEFGELPLDRWLWRVASCRSDVVFVTCIISFFAWDVFFVTCGVFYGTCDVLFVIWGVSLLLEMFFVAWCFLCCLWYFLCCL